VSAPEAPTRSGAAIHSEEIRAAYGRIEVLHGVDLVVPGGSVFALLGPNGAGKTTLLKVVGGRMKPTAGRCWFDGITVRAHSAEAFARAGICSIPEGRGVFPNLTVRDNLRMWTYLGTHTRAEVEERAYARFPRLGERRKQLAGTLSGGEQQMLAVSRALVGDPKVLLLDEISMGLAPLVVGELYDLVRQIAAEGMTVVLVEQFVTTALSVADRAAILLHGKVHREGSPDEMADAALGAYLSGGG
jgi:branched-chain amino acid transport system ATP-binding protein